MIFGDIWELWRVSDSWQLVTNDHDVKLYELEYNAGEAIRQRTDTD